MFIPFMVSAQQVTLGFDFANATKGGTVNPRALDVHAKIEHRTEHREIGLTFE